MGYKLLTDEDYADFKRIVRKVDNIGGPGISHYPDSINIAQPDGNGNRQPLDNDQPETLVVITIAASGGGKYYGNVLKKTSGKINPATGFASSDLGATLCPCLILNASEYGATTHDLTAGTANQIIYGAAFIGYSTETPAKPVYVINGFNWTNCTTA